jgi:hypothetical protein
MSTYTTRIRPTGHSLPLDFSIKRFIPRGILKRGTLFGTMMFIALIAFEIFNYSTTDFALTDLLSDLRFAGIRWATILALAFCGMDFAGIARILTPETNKERPMESWYLLGAWLLAATMNAMLTWWAVSLALLDHQTLGNEIISRESLLNSVPVFVAILVWLLRILMIGIFTISSPRSFEQKEIHPTSQSKSINSETVSQQAKRRGKDPSTSHNRPIRPAPKSKAGAHLNS